MGLENRSQLAFKRRIALLALLHRRPHSAPEIFLSLEKDQLFFCDLAADESTAAEQKKFQFRKDLRALKNIGCKIDYDRASRCYVWQNSPFGLSLHVRQIQALHILCEAFAASTSPYAADIRAFLTFLVQHLPADQQDVIHQHHPFTIDLHEMTNYSKVDAKNVEETEKAIRRSQQLAFVYKAAYKGQERHHVIEPQPLKFQQGHIYLSGRHIESNRELRFRLDYIVPGSAEMLHDPVNKHVRPFTRTYTLRYWLGSAIARNKVSERFPGQQVEYHPDGSATVTAQIPDLFEARRIVLAYGYNCLVLEPPELVAQMREIRDYFNRSYPTPPE
jgi:predicted DNA-binding transcriptional regulator YafY